MTTDPAATTRRRRRGPALRAAVAALAGAGLIAALAPAAAAQDTARPASATDRSADWTALDTALADLTAKNVATSSLAAVRENGRLVHRAAGGVARLGADTPADPAGRFRIGSTTKTFVATVLLQLVGEGRLGLDDRLESLLPGAVPNSADITVRELLNHTSGVADYTQDPAFNSYDQNWLDTGRYTSYSPQDQVDIADKYPPAFRPGQDWQYSNTNYALVALIIERLTGHGWNEEVERRIIRPLGLTGTSMPLYSPVIPGSHAHAYLKLDSGPADVTSLNPSMAGPSGAGISTTADLTTFIRALLGGRLLRPAELAEMQKTTAHGGGQAYGLGLQRVDTPCGAFWGHAGGIPGYSTMMLGSLDGKRQFANSTTFYDAPDPAAALAAWQRAVNAGVCGGQG
ncbi:serine hydrolase domain-containing protein [Kitasatospora sp. NPDC088779]|uniref:serine hydrolase domain-containing protein n=1 Tax=Kitasatospora sp. NPDC088779 TaxID=3154964 RepID=UPI00341CEFDB